MVDILIKGVSSFMIPARGIIAGQGGSMSQSKAVIFPPNKVRQPLCGEAALANQFGIA